MLSFADLYFLLFLFVTLPEFELFTPLLAMCAAAESCASDGLWLSFEVVEMGEKEIRGSSTVFLNPGIEHLPKLMDESGMRALEAFVEVQSYLSTRAFVSHEPHDPCCLQVLKVHGFCWSGEPTADKRAKKAVEALKIQSGPVDDGSNESGHVEPTTKVASPPVSKLLLAQAAASL